MKDDYLYKNIFALVWGSLMLVLALICKFM